MAAAAGRVAAPRRLASFLLAGFVAAILMATVDLATHGALSRPFSDRVYQPAWLNQASVAFAILLLPTSAALVAAGHRLPAMVFAVFAAATIFALAGTAAKTALAAGLPVALLCWYRRAPVARVLAALVVLVVVTAPLTFARLDQVSGVIHSADSVKLSAGHRLMIWSFVGDRIAEHPLRGWGLDSSRAIPGGRDLIRPNETWLPLHPHNAPLQLWLELGVPGTVLFALLAGWLWLAFGRAGWPRFYAAAAGGSLATAFLALLATYGIWQEWWEGTLSFALFIVLVMARVVAGPGPRRPQSRRLQSG
jgi:O-antigen ligase